MSDPQNQIPTFDQVMQKDTQNGKIPSFEDIMGDDEKVKKKESSGLGSKLGGKVGTLEAPLEDVTDAYAKLTPKATSGIPASKIETPKTVVSKEEISINPIGAAGKIFGNNIDIKRYDEANRASSTFVEQPLLAQITKKEVAPKQAEQKKQDENVEQDKKSEELKTTLTELYKGGADIDAMFLDYRNNTNSAVVHLMKRTGIKDPNLLYEDGFDEQIKRGLSDSNETDRVAYERLQKAKTARKTLLQNIQEGKGLEEMAVDYAAANDPEAAKNIEFLKNTPSIGEALYGRTDIDRKPDEAFENATLGRFMYEFLNDGAVAQEAAKIPGLTQQIQAARSELINKYPEFGKMYLGSLISQKMEDMGINNAILNIATKAERQKAVDALVKDGTINENEKRFIDENIMTLSGLGLLGRKVTGNPIIDTPGALEGTVSSFYQGVKSIPKGLYELSGLKDEILGEQGALRKDLEMANRQVGVKPKGLIHEITQSGSQFLGQSLSIGGGGKILNTIKAVNNPRTAMGIVGGLQAYANYMPMARQMFPGNELKQRGFSTIMAGLEWGTENIFNDRKVVDGLLGKLKPGIKETIQDFTTKKISSEAARQQVTGLIRKALRDIPDASKYFVKGVGENTFEELVAQLGQQVTAGVFSGKPVEDWVSGDDLYNTARQAMLGSVFISGLSARADMQRNRGITAKNIYTMAQDIDYWKQKISEAAKLDETMAAEAPEKIQNLEYAAKVLEELNTTDLTEKQKVKFLITELEKKVKGEQAEDVTVKAIHGNQMKEFEKVQKDLLEGKDDGSIEGDKSDELTPLEIRAIKLIPKEGLPGFYGEQDPLDGLKGISHQAQGIQIAEDGTVTELEGGGRVEDLKRMGVSQDLIDAAVKAFPNPNIQADQPTTTEGLKEGEQPTVSQPLEGKGEVSTVKTKEEGTVKEKKETAQSRAKKVYKDIGEIDEPSDVRGLALEYFAGGGKVKEESVNEISGTVKRASLNTGAKEKKSSEVKARDYVSKDGKTIDEIAHSIWDNLPEELQDKISTRDLKNELEDVVNSHNTRLSAATEFRDRYIVEQAKGQLTVEEAKFNSEKDLEQFNELVGDLPENQQAEIIQIIDKYKDKYGIIDWEAMEKDSNGFDPDMLSLHPDTQKSLYGIIEKNIQSGQGELGNTDGKDGGGQKEKAEERLTTAQSNYNKAAAELKKAEDKISQTQATQSGMFDATQKEMFGVDRDAAKKILDPLRQKVKETKSELEAAQKAVSNITEQPKLELNEEKATVKEGEVVEPKKEAGESQTPPPQEPIEPIKEGEGKGTAGITHAANEVRRKERGLPEYQKSPTTEERLISEAEQKLKEGYDVEDLMDRLEKGETPEPVENFIRKIYIATLDAEIAKNPTDALLAKQKRFAIIGDLVNSKIGLNLWSLKGEGSPLETISDFYVAKMEAAGVDKLTEQQKKETQEAFENVQKADKNATAAMEAYRAEIAKLKAENELLRQKKTTTKKGDFRQQRKDAIEGAREALKKLRTGESGLSAVPLPGVRELIAVAPHVKKYVGALLGEGAYTLKEVVTKAYQEFKDILEGITEKDIHNIIAGEYNEKKPTRNELAARMRDLKDEAYYINKLEKLLKGEEPTNEKKRVQRNRQITELREKIKDMQSFESDVDAKKEAALKLKSTEAKDLEKELSKAEKEEAKKESERIKDELKKEKDEKKKAELEDKLLEKEMKYRSKEEIALDRIKTRNERETVKLKERIASGDFETKKKVPFLEDPEMQKKFPKEYKAALDAIVAREEARHEFDIALMKDQMAKRTTGKKAIDLAGDVIGTTKALVTGIDASGIGIQNLVAMIAHPRSAAKALPASFGDFVSAKRMDRWLASVHSSELFPLAKKAGLDITEPQSLKASEREELFTHNLLDRRIKYKGKTYVISKYTTKPFERIFTGLGNRMRWNLWTRGVQKLYEEGYTWESHPKEFESLAKILNTETGRGTLHKQIENSYGFVSAGIWSPRLMASRLNILGLGDLFNLAAGGKKGYYGGLTPKMRAYAVKDFAKFVTFGGTMLALAGLTFADDSDTDPNSPTFGTFSANGKRYNMWGGFTQYVRLATKLAKGGEKVRGEFRPSNQLKTSLRFLWSKTTPAVGVGIGLLNRDNKDYMGEPITAEGAAESMLIPLSIRGIAEGVKREGLGSVFWTGLPSFVGMNVNYESDFEKDNLTDEEKKDPVIKLFSEKGIRFPQFNPEKIQTKEVNGKVTEHLSDYPKEVQDKYIETKKKYFKEELKMLKNGEYEVYRDYDGTVHIATESTKSEDIKEYVSFKNLTTEEIQYLIGANLSRNATEKTKAEVELKKPEK